MKKQSGFTLIELMVVMAIIAILATAGLTAYSNYLKKARDSARAQIARELMTKVEELANGGRLPTPLELIAFLNAENFSSTVESSIVTGLFLPDIDPLSGKGQCISGFCGFYYVTFTDQTYLIGYGIEHSDSAKNWIQLAYPLNGNAPNYIDESGGVGIEDLLSSSTTTMSWFGNFIGTNADSFTNGYVYSPNLRDAQVISSHNLFSAT